MLCETERLAHFCDLSLDRHVSSFALRAYKPPVGLVRDLEPPELLPIVLQPYLLLGLPCRSIASHWASCTRPLSCVRPAWSHSRICRNVSNGQGPLSARQRHIPTHPQHPMPRGGAEAETPPNQTRPNPTEARPHTAVSFIKMAFLSSCCRVQDQDTSPCPPRCNCI